MIEMRTLTNGIEIIYKDSDGATITKIVDPEELASALSNQIKLSTGHIPLGTRSYTRSSDKEYMIYQVPAHIRDLIYNGDTFRVPVPDLMFYLAFNVVDEKRTVAASYLFATKGTMYSDDFQLYNFPYGNVFGDGRICWGSVNVPPFTSLLAIQQIADIFLGSTFNGHLDSGVFREFRDETNTEVDIMISRGSHLMRYLHNKTEFPIDKLSLASCTYKQAEGRMLSC